MLETCLPLPLFPLLKSFSRAGQDFTVNAGAGTSCLAFVLQGLLGRYAKLGNSSPSLDQGIFYHNGKVISRHQR